MTTYYQNPYYDNVFGTLYVNVPSKRTRYKQDENKKIIKIYEAPSSANFEKEMKKWLSSEPDPGWPFKGELFLVISVRLTKKEYLRKDVDNIAKTIIDSLKGVVYEDDTQISSLYVNKRISDVGGFFVAVKCLKGVGERIVPPMYSDTPWE